MDGPPSKQARWDYPHQPQYGGSPAWQGMKDGMPGQHRMAGQYPGSQMPGMGMSQQPGMPGQVSTVSAQHAGTSGPYGRSQSPFVPHQSGMPVAQAGPGLPGQQSSIVSHHRSNTGMMGSPPTAYSHMSTGIKQEHGDSVTGGTPPYTMGQHPGSYPQHTTTTNGTRQITPNHQYSGHKGSTCTPNMGPAQYPGSPPGANMNDSAAASAAQFAMQHQVQQSSQPAQQQSTVAQQAYGKGSLPASPYSMASGGAGTPQSISQSSYGSQMNPTANNGGSPLVRSPTPYNPHPPTTHPPATLTPANSNGGPHTPTGQYTSSAIMPPSSKTDMPHSPGQYSIPPSSAAQQMTSTQYKAASIASTMGGMTSGTQVTSAMHAAATHMTQYGMPSPTAGNGNNQQHSAAMTSPTNNSHMGPAHLQQQHSPSPFGMQQIRSESLGNIEKMLHSMPPAQARWTPDPMMSNHSPQMSGYSKMNLGMGNMSPGGYNMPGSSGSMAQMTMDGRMGSPHSYSQTPPGAIKHEALSQTGCCIPSENPSVMRGLDGMKYDMTGARGMGAMNPYNTVPSQSQQMAQYRMTTPTHNMGQYGGMVSQGMSPHMAAMNQYGSSMSRDMMPGQQANIYSEMMAGMQHNQSMMMSAQYRDPMSQKLALGGPGGMHPSHMEEFAYMQANQHRVPNMHGMPHLPHPEEPPVPNDAFEDCLKGPAFADTDMIYGPEENDTPSRFLAIERQLSAMLKTLYFTEPVAYIYNPLEYAWDPHRQFVDKYCKQEKEVLFVGMNPGPFGMAQTGVRLLSVVLSCQCCILTSNLAYHIIPMSYKLKTCNSYQNALSIEE